MAPARPAFCRQILLRCRLGALAVLLCCLGSPVMAAWEDNVFAALSQEQRQQLREQIRDQWQNKSPEERQRLREDFRRQRDEPGGFSSDERWERRESWRERVQQMPPEDRRAFREELRQRRNEGNPQFRRP